MNLTEDELSKEFIEEELTKHFKKKVHWFERIKFASHKFVNVYFNNERYLPDMEQITQEDFERIVLKENA